MAKRKLKAQFRIPSYASPRNAWRQSIYEAAQRKMRALGVNYSRDERLTVSVVLYLKPGAIGVHDVDNRLKDVLDALQGRLGGPKAARRFRALIPNDNQIFKASVVKMLPPPQSRGLGHVTITKYTD